jgi:hypothetical protein
VELVKQTHLQKVMAVYAWTVDEIRKMRNIMGDHRRIPGYRFTVSRGEGASWGKKCEMREMLLDFQPSTRPKHSLGYRIRDTGRKTVTIADRCENESLDQPWST